VPFHTPGRKLGSPLRKVLLAALALVALTPASSQGFALQEVGGLSSPANGIALGPDGNIWAAEEGAETLVRVSPSGQILGHYPVLGEPVAVATGPGGRVWTSVQESNKLVWFDATSPSPTGHSISTGAASKCGPVAIVSGGNGFMYFSEPSDGSCTNELGRVKDDGTGPVESFATLGAAPVGQAFDLAVFGGKLFAPDFENDVVRRFALSPLSPEAAINAAGNPDGIAVDTLGNVTVTLFSTGKLAQFPAGAPSGNATILTPTGGTLAEPFGIVTGFDGNTYATSTGGARLLTVTAGPTFAFSPLPVGSEPWAIVNGPDKDLWITDLANTRLLHLYNPPPPATTPTGPTTTTAPPAEKKPTPKLSLSGRSKQTLGNFVQLKVSCSVSPCSVGAAGILKIKPAKGAATQPKLKAVKNLSVPAGKPTVLKLKIPARAKEAATKALAGKGGKASAKITVLGQGDGGSSPATVFKVTLKK
jgi:streptogramin lyase